MSLPATHFSSLTLAERVRRAIATNGGAQQAPPSPPATALLLDISGSMAEDCEPGLAKIQALREIVPTVVTGRTAVYSFNSSVRRIRATAIPSPQGYTMMAQAFRELKRDSHTSAVLITDGLPYPDTESEVLEAAQGLHLTIFYVGPPPKPVLLDKLAHQTGGQAHQSSLRKTKELTVAIRGLLGP